MTATAALIARLRRMISEPTDAAPYDDAALSEVIERYPMVDERGVSPYYYDTSTDPPTQVAVIGWYPVYDLAGAAAELWNEKAAAEAVNTDELHEGRSYRYSQTYAQYLKQAQFWAARRSARTVKLIASPSRLRRGDSYVGNLPEDD